MTTLVTYSLQVLAPPAKERDQRPSTYISDADKRVLSNLPAIIEAAEEDLTDLLPEGYKVVITEAMA